MKGLIILFSLLIFSSACSTLPGDAAREDLPLVGSEAALIVDDLVDVLVQLLDPLEVTVQFTAPDTAYGSLVIGALRSRSFGMQRVSDDQGANYLIYSEQSGNSSGRGQQFTYIIGIGGVRVERSYGYKGRLIEPRSTMLVRGSNRAATLDLARFGGSEEERALTGKVEYRDNQVVNVQMPRITLVTEQLVSEIASTGLELPNETGLNSANVETTNIYYTNESNFSSITRNYNELRREAVFFSDDSMRLRTQGKRQIQNFYKSFNKDTDFINLIGCSQGVTKRKIGNEGLALGRAKRVLDEFVALGAPRTSLLDEGCWAGEATQVRYPGRAVLMILKRKKS